MTAPDSPGLLLGPGSALIGPQLSSLGSDWLRAGERLRINSGRDWSGAESRLEGIMKQEESCHDNIRYHGQTPEKICSNKVYSLQKIHTINATYVSIQPSMVVIFLCLCHLSPMDGIHIQI